VHHDALSLLQLPFISFFMSKLTLNKLKIGLFEENFTQLIQLNHFVNLFIARQSFLSTIYGFSFKIHMRKTQINYFQFDR